MLGCRVWKSGSAFPNFCLASMKLPRPCRIPYLLEDILGAVTAAVFDMGEYTIPVRTSEWG